jgi:hypothetical protein
VIRLLEVNLMTEQGEDALAFMDEASLKRDVFDYLNLAKSSVLYRSQ